MADAQIQQLAALQERLERVEDLLQIHQLFVDYGRHLDKRDFHAYAQLFSEDGELLLGPLARARGRAEIETVMAKVLGDVPGANVHIISSPAVELDGDRATAEVMWTVLNRSTKGNPVLTMVGHHVDDLVREDGCWRFARRSGFVDIPSPSAD